MSLNTWRGGRVIVVAMTVASALASAGCSISATGFDSDTSTAAEPDFAKSEILSNSPGVADGASELLVAVLLMNSNNTVVVGFKPKISIVLGEGVEARECSTSNSNGISTCVLKASIPGVKRLAVTNIQYRLEKDVRFSRPISLGTTTGVASSAGHGFRSDEGYVVHATVGNPFAGAEKQTASGWKVFGGVEGSVISK